MRIEILCKEEKMTYCLINDNLLTVLGFQKQNPSQNLHIHHIATHKEAMHQPAFWLFNVAMFACGSGDFLVSTHLIPFVTDYGVSATTAQCEKAFVWSKYSHPLKFYGKKCYTNFNL